MGKQAAEVPPFPLVSQCSSDRREKQTVVSDLDGTLVRGRSSFPYFMLVAFEAGGVLRSVLLLLAAPLAYILYHFVSEAAGIKLLIFVTFSGVKAKKIESVSRAVLPKFYSEDLHPESWRVFSSFGRRYVLTANPRIMVEVFAKECLGADEVIGSEIEVTKGGYATGFVKAPGVLVGVNKENALKAKFVDDQPDVGMGDRKTDYPFMSLCKEAYIVPDTKVEAVPRENLPKPLVFHDGRLVCRPEPLNALITLVWLPVGFLLAFLRIAAGSLLPMSIVYYAFTLLGVRVIVRGAPPAPVKEKEGKLGVLFVCSHRTLLDPIFLSVALGRPVSAVTYSISRVSEFLSPIKTVALTRNRESDAANIRKLLEEGDLAICPEGTTCREPFLLRFSALFAELTDQIVPVAMYNRMSMFHGTTATGWKGMDPFFFFMNPSPVYEVNFLNQLPLELTCTGGKTSHEVANYIQRVVAGTLSFECTNFTRKDKYSVLAGNDGTVAPKKSASAEQLQKKASGC
ncbi:glycerol-3-phosphate acyltransferase [Marchantia polymorpha subsp. ruderalis]|uniref:Phospholipid/glycerol acyltransferase domain-containing protein n=2 Tax=Marchantia polymorpha TaxID=3197 RepID=A0AAF6BVX0_MARPO|nr:hypothetical protein MARPO_0074s0011 [Marchantia polymorpha]BBN16154.1 hypothetical protein Mp_7g03880 [Marchantia polymorpha subsp. ruderalis]|eukprot:PTQ35013.1 hypothetical protein MARPO_0074s0011 [Marchantia polymorpha]